MSLDAGQSLRTGLHLVNPNGMQAARWMQAEGAAWGPFEVKRKMIDEDNR